VGSTTGATERESKGRLASSRPALSRSRPSWPGRRQGKITIPPGAELKVNGKRDGRPQNTEVWQYQTAWVTVTRSSERNRAAVNGPGGALFSNV
jgi:hypothetical protein